MVKYNQQEAMNLKFSIIHTQFLNVIQTTKKAKLSKGFKLKLLNAKVMLHLPLVKLCRFKHLSLDSPLI